MPCGHLRTLEGNYRMSYFNSAARVEWEAGRGFLWSTAAGYTMGLGQLCRKLRTKHALEVIRYWVTRYVFTTLNSGYSVDQSVSYKLGLQH